MLIDVDETTAYGIEVGLVEGDFRVGIAYVPAILPETELEALFEERLLVGVGHQHA